MAADGHSPFNQSSSVKSRILRGALKSKREALGLLEETFDGFARRKPHAEHRFRGYKKCRLVFQEWDCAGPSGNKMKIVQWPQHPSRAPFTCFPFWRQACREFADRHGEPNKPALALHKVGHDHSDTVGYSSRADASRTRVRVPP